MKIDKGILIAFCIIFCSAIILIFSRFFWGGTNYLFYFDDDFYYYVKIAQNLHTLGFSTFDGTHLTNGYHPLYFMLLYLTTYVANAGSLSFFYIISGLTVLSVCITFIISQKLIGNMIGINKVSIIISSFIAFDTLLIAKGGMEVILAIPIMLYVLYYIQNKQDRINYIYLGFLYSIMILCRLDSIMFIFLIQIAILYFKKNNRIKNALFILIGLTPFFIYLCINQYFFDTLMPVSGIAKQLRTSFAPVLNPIQSLFSVNLNKVIYALIPLGIYLLNLIFYYFKRNQLNNNSRLIIIPSLIFPMAFIIQQSMFSGWILWPWYFYMFIPSIIAFAILFKQNLQKIDNTAVLYSISAIIVIYSLTFAFGKKPNEYKLYSITAGIKMFEENHKGIYAMGDCAGTPSFVIKSPVVQLEGLVMDKEYLSIFKKGNLKSIFEKYKIHYYITYKSIMIDSIWYCTEPSEDHPYIRKARCKMKFNPIDTINYHGINMFIFDVKSNLSKIE